jgi:hypothetical protein
MLLIGIKFKIRNRTVGGCPPEELDTGEVKSKRGSELGEDMPGISPRRSFQEPECA